MPDVINQNGITYCGIQATEVTTKPAFLSPEWQSYFDIYLGIKSKQQLVLDDYLENIIQSSDGCGRDVTGQVITLTEKFIEICYGKVNLDQCARGLDAIFMEEWLRSGNEKYDITGTKVASYISEKVSAAMKTDLWTLIWFGNTALTTEQVLGICDGFWTRLIALANAYDTSFVVYRTLPNTEAELAADATLTALRYLHENASPLLKAIPKAQKYFAMTPGLYNNYLRTNEDACCGDRGMIMLNGGVEKLYFRGIELREELEWGRAIDRFNLSNENRILYTYDKNLIVGTDVLSDTNTFEILYNPFDKTNQVDAEFNIATQYKYKELSAIAY